MSEQNVSKGPLTEAFADLATWKDHGWDSSPYDIYEQGFGFAMWDAREELLALVEAVEKSRSRPSRTALERFMEKLK